jgi:hypothetical protein
VFHAVRCNWLPCTLSCARRLRRILRGMSCAACRLQRTVRVLRGISFAARGLFRARTHTRVHTLRRIGMVGCGAGSGGSQAGGRGAVPAATGLSRAPSPPSADGTNHLIISHCSFSAARSPLHSVECMLSVGCCLLHVVRRTLSAARSRRTWLLAATTALAAATSAPLRLGSLLAHSRRTVLEHCTPPATSATGSAGTVRPCLRRD